MTLQTVLDEIQKRPGTGEVIPIIDPATEEPITEFTDCGEEAVNEGVARAKASFESGVWFDMPGRERAKITWRIADLMDQHADDLAQLDSLNTGMPLMQAQMIVPICADSAGRASRPTCRRSQSGPSSSAAAPAPPAEPAPPATAPEPD